MEGEFDKDVWDRSSDDDNPWDEDIRRYRAAATIHEKIESLKRMVEKIQRDENSKEMLELAMTILQAPSLAEDSRLLEQTQRTMDHIGMPTCISACNQILRGNTVSQTLEEDPVGVGALRLTLRVIKHMLCTMPPNDEISIPQNADKGDNKTYFRNHMQTSYESDLEWVVGKCIVFLPQLIANACHMKKSSVPQWAVKSNLFPRIVECSVAKRDSKLLECLLARLIEHRSSDEVAVGIHRSQSALGQHGKATGNLVGDFLAKIAPKLRQRECATLLRSILRHFIATEGVIQPSQSLPPYLGSTCNPLMRSSRSVRAAFLRLISFNASSVLMERNADRILCQLSVMLLVENGAQNGNRSVYEKSADVDGSDSDSTSESDSEASDDDTTNEVHGPYRRILAVLLRTWSQPVFVQTSEVSLQNHVSDLILCTLDSIPKDISIANWSVMKLLMSGVTNRLGSSDLSVRKDGMRVAERVAVNMGQELKFDELNEERDKDEATSEIAGGVSRDNSVTKVVPTRSRRKKVVRKFVDPDADYDSDEDLQGPFGSSRFGDRRCGEEKVEEVEDFDSDSDDDSIWGDRDDLVPYDLQDDEEDLRITPRPMYLGQCLELLRTAESEENAHSHHATALEELPRLVRSRPSNLQDYAVSLTIQVLRMEDKFETEGFMDMTHDGLCALVVGEPVLVASCLVGELFEDGSLSHRLTVLSVLSAGAWELSGNKAIEEAHEKRSSPSITGVKNRGTPEHRRIDVEEHMSKIQSRTAAVAAASNGSKTRLKPGSLLRNRDRETLLVTNEFGPIAHIWFYSLVKAFIDKRDDATLWSGTIGAQLLSSFFLTLAKVVQCAGPTTPGVEVMARDLLQLVWSFCDADVAEVRSSVLTAAAVSLSLASGSVRSQFVRESQIRNLSKNDPDPACRALAARITKFVIDSTRSLM